MFVILDSVVTAFVSVINPEIHRPITELNMVSLEDVTTDGSSASAKVLLTTVGCLLRNAIAADVKSALGALEGTENVTVEMGAMNDEQKKTLREKPNGERPGKEIPFVQSNSLMRVIVVISGKGGIGKSSITANLVVTTTKSGLKVDVMDADIYGFLIPRILGAIHEPQVTDGTVPPLLGTQGVKIMLIGMFVPDGQPVIWRGPVLHRTLRQSLAGISQDDLDVLLIDMPPDTGDAAIPIAQFLPNSQILVVAIPQVAAAEVAERAGSIVSQTQQRVIGVTENISYLSQPNGSRPKLFNSGGGASVSVRLSAQFGYETPLLTQVPLDIALHEDGDVSRPVTLDDDPVSQTLSGPAERLSTAERGLSGRPPGVLPVQK